MVYCTNGLDWSLDELEHFVNFYRNAQHRVDDFFRILKQITYNKKKSIDLKRNITGFCYFERRILKTSIMRFEFNVKGPSIFDLTCNHQNRVCKINCVTSQLR